DRAARAAHADRDHAGLPRVADRARLAGRRVRRPFRCHARMGMAAMAGCRDRLGIETLLRDHLNADPPPRARRRPLLPDLAAAGVAGTSRRVHLQLRRRPRPARRSGRRATGRPRLLGRVPGQRAVWHRRPRTRDAGQEPPQGGGGRHVRCARGRGAGRRTRAARCAAGACPRRRRAVTGADGHRRQRRRHAPVRSGGLPQLRCRARCDPGGRTLLRQEPHAFAPGHRTMSLANFSFPTAITFGAGSRKEVRRYLQEQGVKRPLLVTDKALAALPVLAEFLVHLQGLEVAVYSGVAGNPTASQVMAGAQAFRAHRADAVIGFGGGAALDVAKVVGLAATLEGDIIEYAWDHPKVRAVERELPCFVALPTTSGTGSEVGRSSVISEDATHLKRVVFSPKILARKVFADPELTLALPAHVTAATGIDALTHNVESYLSPAYHPLCDGIALEGTRLVARSLVKAVREPGNLQARSDMMMASMMGAIAFQKDLGAVHSCAHALGAVCDMHHGLANALMIDTVLAWNAQAVPQKFDELAHAVGVSGGGNGFLAWLRALKQTIGIAPNLTAAGVSAAAIPRLVGI